MPGGAQHIFEVDKNSLGCLRPQIDLGSGVLIDTLEGFKHQVELPDISEVIFPQEGQGMCSAMNSSISLLVIAAGSISSPCWKA